MNEIVDRILSDYREEAKCGYSVFVIGEEYFVLAGKAYQSENLTRAEEIGRKAERIWHTIRRQIPEDPKHQAMAAHLILRRIFSVPGS